MSGETKQNWPWKTDPTKSHPKFSRDAPDVGIKRCMAFLGISIFWAMADIWIFFWIFWGYLLWSKHQAMAEHASYSIQPSARVSKKRGCPHHDIIMEPNDHPLNSKCLVGWVFFLNMFRYLWLIYTNTAVLSNSHETFLGGLMEERWKPWNRTLGQACHWTGGNLHS